MTQWVVESGDERWIQEADEAFEAAVAAVKRRPPEGFLGQIMEVHEPHVESMSDDSYLMSTIRVLEAAGLRFIDHSAHTSEAKP